MSSENVPNSESNRAARSVRVLSLELDIDDWDTIQSEIAHQQAVARVDGVIISAEGDSNIVGAMLAEAIRDLVQYRTWWEAEHGKG